LISTKEEGLKKEPMADGRSIKINPGKESVGLKNEQRIQETEKATMFVDAYP